jgi:uncharacterized protein (TIGR02453 family)
VGTAFRGYSKAARTWLRGIADHNGRDWFRSQRPTFEAEVLEPTHAFVAALNDRLRRFAPDYVSEPPTAVHRIQRDLRFGRDKTPYKTHVAATFRRADRERDASAILRFSVSATEVVVLGGALAPPAPALRRVRACLAEDFRAFRALCRRRALRAAMGELQGETLVRVPRGWPSDHPAADLLRRKQLYFRASLPGRIATTPDLPKEVARRFRLLVPVVAFLDGAMGSDGA